MKKTIIPSLALIVPSLFAQDTLLTSKQVDPVIDILTHDSLQTSKEISLATSKLEDLRPELSCPPLNPPEQNKCEGFANSLLPSGYKEKGWQTLLEIKYRPVEAAAGRSSARVSYKPKDFTDYRLKAGGASELHTKEDLEKESSAITAWYQENQGVILDPFEVKSQLMLEQLTTPAYYEKLSGLDAQNKAMFARLKEYASAMSDEEYLRFITMVAGYVDYNDERSYFRQEEGAGKGRVTPFEQIMGTNSGICGDIHSMAAKMGEQKGWEAFTVGYAVSGSQHVVTAMVNPKNPDQLMVVNYGSYDNVDLKNGDWIDPTPSSKNFSDVGIQLRIFKNKNPGDVTGKMQQIATIPTALGSFMNELFQKDYQIKKAMPQNENFRSEKVTGGMDSRQVKVNEEGTKITDKTVGNGIIIYEGQTNNANIYGVAVSHDVYKELYRWDEEQKKCVPKKSKYFSTGLAGNFIDMPEARLNTLYVYLNMKGGQIFHIYQSEHFQFKGVLGYELEGFWMMDHKGQMTADGNLATFVGAMADFEKKGFKIHSALTYEMGLGLRDQGLMTDFSTLPKNLNPVNFNAVSLDLDVSKQLSPKVTLFTNNNLAMTRVGSRVLLSSGVLVKNSSIMASYQGGMKAIPLGNSLQSVNLLQNYNNMDGFRITLGQNFSNKKGTFSASVSAYGGMSTSTHDPQFNAGATLKVNLGGKKKKPVKKKAYESY